MIEVYLPVNASECCVAYWFSVFVALESLIIVRHIEINNYVERLESRDASASVLIRQIYAGLLRFDNHCKTTQFITSYGD